MYSAPSSGLPYRERAPIAGPEAFEESSRAARLSQSAFLLAVGAGVGGRAEIVQREEAFPLPRIGEMGRERPLSPPESMRHLDVASDELLTSPSLTVPAREMAPLARDVFDKPDAAKAASLIEGSLHNADRLVRTAAAAAALDTAGPRRDVTAVLAESVSRGDSLIRDIARAALVRVRPDHPRFRFLLGRPARVETGDRGHNTAVLTHGSFARRQRWWAPGGAFYRYLGGFKPSLHLLGESFAWSGAYSSAARELASRQLRDWLAARRIAQPDFFAHSHGGTVANLATRIGARLNRLVLLSWPHHRAWRPDFASVERIIDIRVRLDLVIMVDRGGQRFRAPKALRHKLEEHRNGWFDHGDTHDPAYWDRYDLPSKL